ncbi:hypothetical protein R6Q59_030495 [Mikania micrantha]
MCSQAYNKRLLVFIGSNYQENKARNNIKKDVWMIDFSTLVDIAVTLAVKRLKSINAKAEMEFAVEVEILGRVQHKNLLGLKGFYAGGEERLIVYDYMPNHSLLTHLHGQLAADCHLDWSRRISIAIGSAEGLAP